MEEVLITYPTAVLAKEKGFDWPTGAYYSPQGKIDTPAYYDGTPINGKSTGEWFSGEEFDCTAPSQSFLAKWLREVHNLHVEVNSVYNYDRDKVMGFSYQVYNLKPPFPYSWYWKNAVCPDTTNLNYEEVLEAGLLHALSFL